MHSFKKCGRDLHINVNVEGIREKLKLPSVEFCLTSTETISFYKIVIYLILITRLNLTFLSNLGQIFLKS